MVVPIQFGYSSDICFLASALASAFERLSSRITTLCHFSHLWNLCVKILIIISDILTASVWWMRHVIWNYCLSIHFQLQVSIFYVTENEHFLIGFMCWNSVSELKCKYLLLKSRILHVPMVVNTINFRCKSNYYLKTLVTW